MLTAKTGYLEVANVDTLVLPVHLADKVCHLIGRIKAKDEDFSEVLDLDTSLDVMLDDG